jgi:DNA modification methylase
VLAYSSLLSSFNLALGTSFEPTSEVRLETERFLSFAEGREAAEATAMRTALLADVNAKFRLNAANMKAFLTFCAKQKVVFNYHEKVALSNAFDSSDRAAIVSLLEEKRNLRTEQIDAALHQVCFLSEQGTLARLHAELVTPTLTRKDSRPRDWSKEILEGLFCAYVCRTYGLETLHAYNTGHRSEETYEPDFWLYLKNAQPQRCATKPSLVVIGAEPETQQSDLLRRISAAYQLLPEFGYLAIWIASGKDDAAQSHQWRLYADAILFAEKHVRRMPSNSFFKRDAIEKSTVSAVPGIDVKSAEFGVWNDGFYYQDCFLLGEVRPSLLVLLQKRQANEDPIPCPSCRSLNVQGNSYSSLGVKSWECCNILCPAKSKFGRGRRYSFVQLLKQAAIEEPGNDVSPESVKKWLRDVQPERSTAEVLEMLARHYTLAGDSIVLDGFHAASDELSGRQIVAATALIGGQVSAESLDPERFFSSSFFARYDVASGETSRPVKATPTRDGLLSAYLGDSGQVLSVLADASVDGAVTSPPYYNAREYSQWENIYAYLYDMRRVNEQVYRVLKPGAYYLYNIFDYFDNENSVVLSAMGEKRLILGAYTCDLFRRIGFQLEGNVAWDKGAIEGKRGFNGGNFSPYYQAPFNCWEHILVFRKPGGTGASLRFPAVLRHPAVIKIVRGENLHGHTAPFPEAVPALLTDRLEPGSTVLDPFGGSMTTAIAAARRGCKSICIERDRAYFQLGLRRFSERVSEQQTLI